MENHIDADQGVRAIRAIVGRWLTPGSGLKARDAMHQVANVLLDTRLEAAQQVITIMDADTIERNAEWRSMASHDVLAERQRQVMVEGRTPERDDDYTNGELAAAAGSYALHAHDSPDNRLNGAPAWWPWGVPHWKPTDARRMLVKAGALILAEIERLDRAAAAAPTELYSEGSEPDEGWIAWKSERDGTCPVEKGTLVDVRYRDGGELIRVPALHNTSSDRDACGAFWDCDYGNNDIVAYRLSKPDTPAS